MRATQRHDEEVRVTDEADKAEKKVELSLSSPVSCTAISDSSVILPVTSMSENISPETLTPSSIIQDLALNKQLFSASTKQSTDLINQLNNLIDQLLTELAETHFNLQVSAQNNKSQHYHLQLALLSAALNTVEFYKF